MVVECGLSVLEGEEGCYIKYSFASAVNLCPSGLLEKPMTLAVHFDYT
jgi:hypothetical protein